MGKTSIEWTDTTWNPVRGCSRVSEGCRNCYAERSAIRQKNGGYSGFVTTLNGHPAWTGRVELITSKLDEPLHWRAPRRIFVNSMSDLFHEALPAEDIAEVFRVMHRANWHTYQILTKRAQRLAELIPRILATFGVMPNVWIGVSVENQKTAEDRWAYLKLLADAGWNTFFSYEPALGPLYPHFALSTGLKWLIAGGESGPGARAAHPRWFREVRDQCVAAGVPFLFKQWGAWAPLMTTAGECELPFGDYNPKTGFGFVLEGKKAAGRMLDGREWDEFPKPAANCAPVSGR